MFGISGTEFGIILIFALLIFGPDKLPQFGRTIGKFMSEFKKAQESVEATIKAEMYKSDDSDGASAAVVPPVFSAGASDADDEEEDEE